ncbi:MAG: hypothetical protein K2N34_07440 [Lachnospiraceae bacterium]|nr:hypothetical protein [Lachnospiraceae bacterium]
MGSNFLQAAQQFIGQAVQNKIVDKMANVPWKQEAINAILSGDQVKGQELANNILQSYGFSSPEEAVQQGFQNLNVR